MTNRKRWHKYAAGREKQLQRALEACVRHEDCTAFVDCMRTHMALGEAGLHLLPLKVIEDAYEVYPIRCDRDWPFVLVSEEANRRGLLEFYRGHRENLSGS